MSLSLYGGDRQLNMCSFILILTKKESGAIA